MGSKGHCEILFQCPEKTHIICIDTPFCSVDCMPYDCGYLASGFAVWISGWISTDFLHSIQFPDLLGRAKDFQILSLLRLDDILALVFIINHSFFRLGWYFPTNQNLILNRYPLQLNSLRVY
jgi:hypothetical protein